ncbi:hypothetical protein QQ045_016250 [Rhodiola kirilowii]
MNKSSLQLIAIFILFLHLLQPASAHNKSHSDGKKHKSSSGSGAGSGQVQVEVSLKGSFSQVVAFGDSYTDTGNCMFMNGLRRFFGGLIAHSPYGSIFKSPATGNRFCDGRLVIDFLCEALGLPHLPPYKDPKVNVTHGVNFAVSGSTSLTSDVFSKYKIGQGLLWKSMVPQNFLTQLDWFDEFIEKMAARGSGYGSGSGSQRGSGQISGGSATSGQVGGGIGGSSSGGNSVGGGSSGGGSIGGGTSGGGSIGGGSAGGGSIGGGSSGGGSIGGGSSGGGNNGGGSAGGSNIGGGSSGGGSIGGGSSGGGNIGGGSAGGGNIGGGSSGGGSTGGGNIGGGSAGGGGISGGSIGVGSAGGDSASGSGQIGGSGQVSGSGQAGGSARSGQAGGSSGIDLANILVWIGEMGVNDYARIISTSTLTGNWLSQISVDHVTKILKAVLDKGTKYVVVQGLPPIGCLPLALSFAPDSGRDKHGCSEAINTLVKFHNQLLQKRIAEFQAEHKDCVIAYADYYSAYITIMTNVTVYKVQEPLKACCGAGSGPFNFSPKLLCGAGSTAKCSDPSKYIVWDGLHLTEAMHSHLADLFFNKGYCHPSLHEMIAHKSKCA